MTNSEQYKKHSAMNLPDRQHLLGELHFLRQQLSRLPEKARITRMSTESRIRSLEDRLENIPALEDIYSRLKKLIERWDRDGRPETPSEEPTVKERDPFLDNFPGFIDEVNEQTGKTEPKKCSGDKGIPCPCGKSSLSAYSPLWSPKKVFFCSAIPEECGLPESLRKSTFRSLNRVASLNPCLPS